MANHRATRSKPLPSSEPDDWLTLCRHPKAGTEFAWFEKLATRLLCFTQLMVANQPHRLVEIECYHHSPGHPDPFPHRHPLQLESGRWYFHRTGKSFRGGSFKGLDLTLGNGLNPTGILIRSLETPEGDVIDGPSLVVDHLLHALGCTTVSACDQRVGTRDLRDCENPLHLCDSAGIAPRIFRSARVGLNARMDDPVAWDFACRPYRFLTEPRRIRKGRPQLVRALSDSGWSAQAIAQLTGSPLAAIQRYLAAGK